MFYNVYLIESKRYVILPVHWVDENDKHLEKFLNYGGNNNQRFRGYFNNDRDYDIHPNFDDFPIGDTEVRDALRVISIFQKNKIYYYRL